MSGGLSDIDGEGVTCMLCVIQAGMSPVRLCDMLGGMSPTPFMLEVSPLIFVFNNFYCISAHVVAGLSLHYGCRADSALHHKLEKSLNFTSNVQETKSRSNF